MELPATKKIRLQNIRNEISIKRGIYFWFNQHENSVVYIGIAVGSGGLKKRIIQQHLNPRYLEYRSDKHTSKDKFQLQYAIPRTSKTTGAIKLGIDKSAFRKSIGRMLSLKPGEETVEYIVKNLRLEVFETDDISVIKDMEKILVAQFQPIFNTAHKNA